MRYPKEQKEQTRAKILEAAGRLFRERGFDGVGVDTIMAEVGLTAGGFYSHFKSKNALFTEALDNAYNSRSAVRKSGRDRNDPDCLQSLVFSYLSRTHRDMKGDGCIFPAITTDVVRGTSETRDAFEARLKEFISTIEEDLYATASSKRPRAIAILVQLIGGVLLSRAVRDETLSGDILKACRRAAMQLSSGETREHASHQPVAISGRKRLA